jgi:hypothetical protein
MKQEQAQRLFKAIQEIKPVVKDKKNPHFKNTYADINTMLEDVKPIMHANGLFIMQPIIDGCVISQIIDGETGEIIAASSLPINANLAAQAKGSEITYYRRYTLQSLLGLEAEDDDGTKATAPTPQPKKAVKDFEAMKKAVSEDPKLLTTIVAQYELSAVQIDDLQTLITK